MAFSVVVETAMFSSRMPEFSSWLWLQHLVNADPGKQQVIGWILPPTRQTWAELPVSSFSLTQPLCALREWIKLWELVCSCSLALSLPDPSPVPSPLFVPVSPSLSADKLNEENFLYHYTYRFHVYASYVIVDFSLFFSPSPLSSLKSFTILFSSHLQIIH